MSDDTVESWQHVDDYFGPWEHLHSGVPLTTLSTTEHVLRSISGESSRTVTRPQRSSSAVTNSHEGFEPPPNDDFILRGGRTSIRSGRGSRFSPTPSIRRGKIAALLREHASPPGVRVTAGGRLVPDGTSPLTSPRSGHFGKHDQYPHVPHLAPDSVPSNSALKFLDGMIVNIGGTEIAQIVNGQLIHVGYTNSPLNLQMPPTNPIVTPAAQGAPQTVPYYMHSMATPLGTHHATPPVQTANMPTARPENVNKLVETYHDKLAELKAQKQSLDREEVIQRDHITPSVRDRIVQKRKSLTLQIDEIRESLKQLEQTTGQPGASTVYRGAAQYRAPQPVHSTYTAVHSLPTSPAAMHPYYLPQNSPYSPEYSAFQPGAFYSSYPASPTDCMGDTTGATGVSSAAYGYAPFQQQGYTGNELQERAVNVGPDVVASNPNLRPKAPSQSVEATGINLDGSVVQPRRSHAIEIKCPQDSTATSRGGLNPTSPVYDPTQLDQQEQTLAEEKSDASTVISPHHHRFHTSKRLTQTDPGPEHRSSAEETLHSESSKEHERTGDSFRTSSTAKTTDFFPTEPGSHSSHNWAPSAVHGASESLTTWLPRVDQPVPGRSQLTPTRLSNKYLLDDGESPDEPSFKTAAQTSARSSLRERTSHASLVKVPGSFGESIDVSAKPPPLDLSYSTPNKNNPSTRATVGGSANTSFDSDSHCENLIDQKRSKSLGKSPPKRGSYWHGFTTCLDYGSLNELRYEFCRGYRDGLIRLGARAEWLSFRENHHIGSRSFPSTNELLTEGSRLAELSRCSSLPSIQPPRVPSNTAVSSPLRQSVENGDAFAGAATVFDNGGLISGNQQGQPGASSSVIVPKTSYSRVPPYEPTSPLAERNLRNASRQPSSASKAQRSSSRIFSDSTFDQQRYSRKGTTSIAPSSGQAWGRIGQQLDGSNEEDDRETWKQTAPVVQLDQRSPVQDTKVKEAASSSSSPIKRASSAVYKLTQISGMSRRGSVVGGDMANDIAATDGAPAPKTEKKDDPAKMSSPEKAKWKSKWRKRFESIRNDEQKEIDAYKRANP